MTQSAAWIFPGQGSQKPKMAEKLSACAGLFEAAGPAGADLQKLCITDAKPVLSPELLQPALFITCVGAADAIKANGMSPQAVAGHSLGEYAALVAAKVISFEEALEVVFQRARAMAAAARANAGGMAAVIGLEQALVQSICDETGGVWVANINSPMQTVISGREAGLAAAAEKALKAGAGRVVRLEVPMAGHSPLMEDAAAQVEAALSKVKMNEPICPFYSVADAQPHSDPSEIAELLVAAVTSPVCFTQTVSRMKEDGFNTLVEVGPGRVLRGLVRQIDPEISMVSIGSDEEAKSHLGTEPAVPTAAFTQATKRFA